MIRLYNQNIWGNMPREARISNRNDIIKELVFENAPDFCNFQECNPKTSRGVENAIHEIIAGRYAESNAAYAHENFTPVFYLKDKFTELDGGFVLFEGLNDINSKSITWGLFEDKETKTRVVIVSTHFWWKATEAIDHEQRVANAGQLRSVCDMIIEKYGEIPMIISGDFNSSMNKPGYEAMIQNGFTDVRFKAKNSTDCHTLHEYPVLTDAGVYVPYELAPNKTIDYVFTYGKSLEVTSFKVLADARALTTSDHCPILAEFNI